MLIDFLLVAVAAVGATDVRVGNIESIVLMTVNVLLKHERILVTDNEF